MTTTETKTEEVKLHRNLSVWEAIGISLALMAPSMAASINPQGTAGTVGRAVPLAFALAFVGVLLVAYTFVRLTQRFHHSGSVYGFVGATLGPRAGSDRGLGTGGTYIFYAVTTAMAGGRFAAGFLDSIGVWKSQPTWAGFLLGAAGLLLVWWLAITPARGGTRVLLAAEGDHGAADRHRHRDRVRQARRALAGRASWGGLVGVQRAVRNGADRDVPRRGVRLPVLRRLRGRVHPR